VHKEPLCRKTVCCSGKVNAGSGLQQCAASQQKWDGDGWMALKMKAVQHFKNTGNNNLPTIQLHIPQHCNLQQPCKNLKSYWNLSLQSSTRKSNEKTKHTAELQADQANRYIILVPTKNFPMVKTRNYGSDILLSIKPKIQLDTLRHFAEQIHLLPLPGNKSHYVWPVASSLCYATGSPHDI